MNFFRWLATGLCLACCSSLFVIHSLAQELAEKPRIWKDKTGIHRVEATLDSVSANAVRLRRADNDKVVEVPLSTLSDGDLEYLRKVAPEAFESENERPKTAAALEAAAKTRRYALAVVVMYKAFLEDPDVPAEEKAKAGVSLERWKPLASSAKIRTGTNWYTPAEFADLENDESQLISRAEEQLLAGDPASVKSTLEEAAKLNPSSIRATFRLGILSALHPRGLSAKQAQQYFTDSVRRLQSYSGDWNDVDKANLAACYNNLALTNLRQRDVSQAIAYLEKSSNVSPPTAELSHNLGRLKTLAQPQTSARSGATNAVYLSPAERIRLDRLASRIDLSKHDAARGWRYARLAKAPSKPIEPAPASDPTAAIAALPPHLVQVGTGTGFVIGKNHIATNRHVADAGVGFKVRFESDVEASSRVASLQFKSSSTKVDLALLQCNDLPASPLSFSKVAPRLSEEIRVLGFPLGELLGANIKVSRGIVASLPPLRGIPDESLERAMLHDAATEGGSSGGPVCNHGGEIIGVHFASIRGRGYKACVPALDAIPFFQPHVPDLVVADGPAAPLEWEAAVEQVRRSTVQVIIYAEPDSLDPVDKSLGKAQWDAYDDVWCMACYGRRTLDCPVRGCSRGTVGSFEDKYIPNPTGVGGRTQRVPIRLKCDKCNGAGRIKCGHCQYGIDPALVTNTNRAWILRYVALLSNAESSD